MESNYSKKSAVVRYLKRWTNQFKELDFDFNSLDELNVDEQIDKLIEYYKSKGETREQIENRIKLALHNYEENKKHGK